MSNRVAKSDSEILVASCQSATVYILNYLIYTRVTKVVKTATKTKIGENYEFILVVALLVLFYNLIERKSGGKGTLIIYLFSLLGIINVV
jgi:hypothetical protein